MIKIVNNTHKDRLMPHYLLVWSNVFLYSEKGIGLYIPHFDNAGKIYSKVIPSTFSSLLFLVVTLLDTRSV